MKASYCKSGINFLPVILYEDGTKEVIYGPPLVTIERAKYYAQLEINIRIQAINRKRKEKEKTCTESEGLGLGMVAHVKSL